MAQDRLNPRGKQKVNIGICFLSFKADNFQLGALVSLDGGFALCVFLD